MPISTVRSPVTATIRAPVGGGAADPFGFHALTFDTAASDSYDAYEMLGVKTGTGDLTEARTSTIYAADHENVYRAFGSGEPAYKGGRVVENLALYSEDFSNAAWTKTSVTLTHGQIDPSGGTTATRVEATSANAILRQNVLSSDNYSDRSFVNSVWIRRVSGSGAVWLHRPDYTTVDISGSLTSAWSRFSLASSGYDGVFPVRAASITIATSGDVVEVAFAQTEETTGRSDTTTPSEYVPTTTAAAKKVFANANGNSVASNVVTEATGAPLAEEPWLVAQPALTNSLTYSKPDTSNWTLTEGSAGDLVTNGDFATDSDWTKGTGWSIGSGVASCDGTQTANTNLIQNVGLTTDTIYKITFTVSNYSAGSVKGFAGYTYLGTDVSANGTYTQYIRASNSSAGVRANSSFIGDIDDVIVIPAVVESNTTGLDGASDSAVVLTDDDGAAQEFVTEKITISDDSNTHTARYFVKKDSDETRFPMCGLAYTGGTQVSSFWHLNTKTGATTARGSNSAGAAVDVKSAGDWWEVLASAPNNSSGNTNCDVYGWPADGTVFGTQSSAATGSIIVGNVELHLNTTIGEVRGSGPIFTSGASATTNATDLSFDDANHDDTQGGYYAESMLYSTDAANNQTPKAGCIGVGLSGACLYFRGASDISSYDGTNLADGTYTAANGTPYKLAVAYGSSNHRINVDGSWGTAATFTGYTNSESKIRIGSNSGFTGPPGATEKNGVHLLRNIRRYDLSYTDAQTTIDGLMVDTFSWLGADETRYTPSVARFRDADGTISETTWAFKDADGTDYTVN